MLLFYCDARWLIVGRTVEYGVPVDEREIDRIDMKHEQWRLILEDQLFLAPVAAEPTHVLDLGTGSGIWAIDVADRYKGAEVLGVDLAAVQPTWTPKNCFFEIDDVEDEWTFQKDHFDLIHARDFIFSIRDWPRLIGQAYEHLAPAGWLELKCIHPEAKCDDGSTPPDSALVDWCTMTIKASEIAGFSLHDPVRFKGWMERAGFVDVVELKFKVPVSVWDKGERMKLIGALERESIIEGSQAFTLRAFNRAFGWTAAETELFNMKMRADLNKLKYHTYFELSVPLSLSDLSAVRC